MQLLLCTIYMLSGAKVLGVLSVTFLRLNDLRGVLNDLFLHSNDRLGELNLQSCVSMTDQAYSDHSCGPCRSYGAAWEDDLHGIAAVYHIFAVWR